MAASPSLSRLKSRRSRHRLKSLAPQFNALIQALDAIQPTKRLPLDTLSLLRSTVRNARRYAQELVRRNARREANYQFIRWQRNNGIRLAQTRNLNAQLEWLLNRQHRGRGLYAMAQGKRTFQKLGREHYVRIGKLGAAKRWHKDDLI